jgi:hypothetical protein
MPSARLADDASEGQPCLALGTAVDPSAARYGAHIRRAWHKDERTLCRDLPGGQGADDGAGKASYAGIDQCAVAVGSAYRLRRGIRSIKRVAEGVRITRAKSLGTDIDEVVDCRGFRDQVERLCDDPGCSRRALWFRPGR